MRATITVSIEYVTAGFSTIEDRVEFAGHVRRTMNAIQRATLDRVKQDKTSLVGMSYEVEENS